MSDLSIGNVFEVSVSAPGVGIGQMNTSNLGVLTHEAYNPSFGSAGYKIYVDPREALKDFGSASVTYKMINAIFSQRPNIRLGNGYAVVMTMLSQIQSIVFSAVPTSGGFTINIDGQATSNIAFGATASAIQTLIRALGAAYSGIVVTGTVGATLEIDLRGYEGAGVVTVPVNTLLATATPVTATPTPVRSAETPEEALVRTVDLVNYFGILYTQELAEADLLEVAAALAPMRKIGFFLGSAEEDNEDDGKLDLLRQNGFVNSRGLLRLDTELNGLLYCADYASRMLSVDFSGSNATLTMHLKDLIGLVGDSNITQSILEQCKVSGADVYINFDRNVAKTFTSGANDYADNVYNILSFVDALQVAGFNALAQTPTKLPQTEGGLDVIKGSSRKVCEKYVRNGFISPGEWTSPTTFGPQDDFYDNIRQRGYFIWAVPISQQSVADREARKAPLVQIAIKYAGAFHSGSILVTINE